MVQIDYDMIMKHNDAEQINQIKKAEHLSIRARPNTGTGTVQPFES